MKFVAVLVLVFSVCLISCQENDDGNKTNENESVDEVHLVKIFSLFFSCSNLRKQSLCEK